MNEDREQKNRAYLQEIKRRWDRACERLNIKIEEWKSDDLLRRAGEAFRSGDAMSQAAAVEQIRIQIAHSLMQKAIAANNPDLQSASAVPSIDAQVTEEDIDRGKTKLHFFSGTSGERVLVSADGLRLPWVHDEKHYTRKTNLLLREVMKELFPTAEGEEGHDLMVQFVK